MGGLGLGGWERGAGKGGGGVDWEGWAGRGLGSAVFGVWRPYWGNPWGPPKKKGKVVVQTFLLCSCAFFCAFPAKWF